jgi:hypothetical protein
MPNTPHDGLFKATFSQVEHAAGELRAILPPALVTRLDFSTLTLCPGSFVDEAFSWRHTDLLFTATFAGRPAMLLLWCLKHARRQGFFEHELGGWGGVIREAWNVLDGGLRSG